MPFKFRQSIIASAYFYILLPVVIVLPMLIISIVYFNWFYTDSIEERYAIWLESACSENELVLQSITKNVQFLETDAAFISVMRSDNRGEEHVSHSVRQLRRIVENYPIIDSVCILSLNSGMVYSTDGNFTASDYLDERYSYAEYDYEYWDEYKEPLAEKQILPPSQVSTPEGIKTIVPIVFTRIGDVYTNNILIVNVSLQRILGNLEKESLEDGIRFGVINRRTNTWFGSNVVEGKEIEQELRDCIRPRGMVSFNYNFEGIDSFVLAYSPTQSILGYTYVSVIPNTVLHSMTYRILLLMAIIWLLIFVIIVFLTRFSAKTLYAPIYRMLNIISQTGTTAGNEFSVLENYIANSKDTISAQLPFVQEGLLTEFLCTQNPDYAAAKKRFEQSGLYFPYDYFCTVIVRVRFTGQYYRMVSEIRRDEMIQNLQDVLTTLFSDIADTYNITFAKNTLYVLLCMENDNMKEAIQRVMAEFVDLLKSDNELIQLRIAIGDIGRGLEGAKRSHDMAVLNLEGVASPLDDPGAQPVTARERHREHPYGVQEEGILVDYLNAGKIPEARTYINQIIYKNKQANCTDVVMWNLYTRILNTVLNVMRLKNLRYNGNKVDEMDIVSEFFSLPPDEMREMIERMLDIIEQNIHVSKLNISEIISYIQAHYTEDLRLEELADKYKTSAPYLSRILKESLGVPFIEYVAVLRIKKAKELIADTDKPITEISEMVGFSSRTAFVRAFKKRTDMTPSLYRKAAQNR